jgi:AraC-like DNA-binding protein
MRPDIVVESLDRAVVTHEPDTAASIVVCLPSATVAVVGPRLTATYAEGSPITRVRIRLPLGTPAPVGEIDLDEAVAILTRPTQDDLVTEAARLLSKFTVRETAQRLYVSERHLRSTFTTQIGLSPKKYARIERVRTVLRRIGEGDLARLAADVGYYDQSHLANEFRAVMGISPGAYAKGHRPPAVRCTA